MQKVGQYRNVAGGQKQGTQKSVFRYDFDSGPRWPQEIYRSRQCTREVVYECIGEIPFRQRRYNNTQRVAGTELASSRNVD